MRWLAIVLVLGCGHPAVEPAPTPRAPPADATIDPAVAIDAGVTPVAVDAGAGKGKVVVTETDECGFILDMIYFDPGSAAIKAMSKPILDATADMFKCWYRTHEVLRWELQGHTDTTEKDAARLSEARAAAVKQALVERGVLAATLEPKGYAASLPLDRRGTDFARAKNRRVMFLVLERGK